MNILMLQGANMEYLGYRQPEIYGTTTADQLDDIMRADAAAIGATLDIVYTNVEGEAISRIYEAVRSSVDGLLMNPAGFLYAGYALRDCLKSVPIPYVEIHMSNIDARGMDSVTASESACMVTGLGIESYRLGLIAMQRILTDRA